MIRENFRGNLKIFCKKVGFPNLSGNIFQRNFNAQTFPRCPVLASYLGHSALSVLSGAICQAARFFRPTYLSCPVPNVLSWPSCHCCPVTVVLSQLPCPVLVDLSWLFCPTDLSHRSCPDCPPQLSCPSILVSSYFIPALLSLLPSSEYPVLSVLSRMHSARCPLSAILNRLTCLLSCPDCLGCHYMAEKIEKKNNNWTWHGHGHLLWHCWH